MILDHQLKLLSTNSKTGYALNFPRANCRPTAVCSKLCYGKCGPISWHDGKLYSFNRYFMGTDISQLVEECRGRLAIRLSATGDLLPKHLPNVFRMATSLPETQFWGMTRKPDIARAINDARLSNLSILVSVDASSTRRAWEYQGGMCYGPRRAEDTVPEDNRIVTVFPYHHAGKIKAGIPAHPKDCPSLYDHRGCHACGRCWKWRNLV